MFDSNKMDVITDDRNICLVDEDEQRFIANNYRNEFIRETVRNWHVKLNNIATKQVGRWVLSRQW